MSKKQKIETAEFFYRYYLKRSSSFHANIYKAGITVSNKDIHKSRVDLKQVFTLFGFFELIGGDGFKRKKYLNVFLKIFRSAGKIREHQINIAYLEDLEMEYPGTKPFLQFLRAGYKESINGFLSSIIQFDEKKFKEIRYAVKKLCLGMDQDKIIIQSELYILGKSAKIEKLNNQVHNDENIHKIRKTLKKIDAILTLVNKVVPEEDLENLLKQIKKSEVDIGNWHDDVVLLDYLHQFIRSGEKNEIPASNDIFLLRDKIQDEVKEKLEVILPDVREVVKTIRKTIEKREGGATTMNTS